MNWLKFLKTPIQLLLALIVSLARSPRGGPWGP